MKSAKKTGMKKKAKRVSKIAKGRGAKARVFNGSKASTVGGLKKSDLTRNKNGKVVSKKSSARAKKAFVKNGLGKWTKAVQQAKKGVGNERISNYWWKNIKRTSSSQEGSIFVQEVEQEKP